MESGSAAMIKATVPGKLGGDAETKTVGTTTVTEFSVATDEREKTKGGAWEKRTEWVRCTLWGDRGEKLAQYLTKGTSVTVFGSLTKEDYVSNAGKAGSSLRMRVDDVVLQGSKRDGDDRGQRRDEAGADYDRPRGTGAGPTPDDFGGGDSDGFGSEIPFGAVDERCA
jgi:single-strand DNA-binding protein